jgi:hypothetical protein
MKFLSAAKALAISSAAFLVAATAQAAPPAASPVNIEEIARTAKIDPDAMCEVKAVLLSAQFGEQKVKTDETEMIITVLQGTAEFYAGRLSARMSPTEVAKASQRVFAADTGSDDNRIVVACIEARTKIRKETVDQFKADGPQS